MGDGRTYGETVTIRLDGHHQRAEFRTSNRGGHEGSVEFTLAPAEGGFALRVPDPVDPTEERFGTWAEAVAAFAEDVRSHVAASLLGLGEGDEERMRQEIENLTHDQAGRLLRAIFGRR